MHSVVILAAAAGLVAADHVQHQQLHKRATTTSAPCPAWTGGSQPPAFLTDLPASIQSELPAWTGAPPSDWCSYTSWMQSYTSANTVGADCTASQNATGTSTSSGSSSTTTSSGMWGVWVDPTSTASSSSSSSTAWGTWVDPTSSSASSSVTWGTWADPASSSSSSSSSSSTVWGTWADPASSSSSSSSSSSIVWGTWADPASSSTSSASVCGCTTTVVTVYGDPTWAPDVPTTTTVSSTTYTTVTVQPTALASSSTTRETWADPSSSSSSSSTTWATWADPSSTSSSSSSSSTTWATWADPSSTLSSSSSSSTTWATWADGSSSSSSSSSSTVAVATWVTSSSAASSASPSSSSSSSGGSGNAAIAPSGNYWAITYTPYTSSGGCKDAGTVKSDITEIKNLGFTTVRIYSTDCSGLQNVGAAAADVGLKIILGVFIESSGISGAQPQVSEIISWGQWSLVEMIVVGNEALSNNYVSVSDLAGFISSSKWAFKDAGYTGPVTTTEPLNIWQQEGSQLCSAIDVVAANLYAFFNAQTTADQAGSFIASEIQILEGICPGYKTYVVESGWPHAGEANGLAVPGVAEQETAIKSIQSAVGSQVVFFTYEDDLWKNPGAFDVEQSWGCAGVFGGSDSGS